MNLSPWVSRFEFSIVYYMLFQTWNLERNLLSFCLLKTFFEKYIGNYKIADCIICIIHLSTVLTSNRHAHFLCVRIRCCRAHTHLCLVISFIGFDNATISNRASKIVGNRQVDAINKWQNLLGLCHTLLENISRTRIQSAINIFCNWWLCM